MRQKLDFLRGRNVIREDYDYKALREGVLPPLSFEEEGGRRVTIFSFSSPLPPGEGLGVREKRPTNEKNLPLPPKLLSFARELRKEQTDAENLMWYMLRDRRLMNIKFRRQYPMKPYILDFYCHALKIAVELDGGQHAERIGYDEARTRFLGKMGIQVLRFWNNDVLLETEAVLETIWNALYECLAKNNLLPEGDFLV